MNCVLKVEGQVRLIRITGTGKTGAMPKTERIRNDRL